MKVKKCKGCGAVLQAEDQNKKGYVKDIEKHLLCKRCFDIKNYSKQSILDGVSEADVFKMMEKIPRKNQNIVLVTDILNFNEKIPVNFNNIVGDNDLYILINKIDILPKSLKDHKIDTYVRSVLKEKDIRYKKLIYVSALKKMNIDYLLDLIKESDNKTTHFIGYTNVGKSSILNSLSKSIDPHNKNLITVSNISGTTLGTVDLKIDDINFIDYPGMYNKNSYFKIVNEDQHKFLNVTNELRQTNYQLNEQQSILGNKFFIIETISQKEKNNIQIFMPPKIQLHRSKLENEEKAYSNMASLEFKYNYSDLKSKEIKIPNDNNAYDFILTDLGRVRVIGQGQTMVVKFPKEIDVNLVKSLIKKDNKYNRK